MIWMYLCWKLISLDLGSLNSHGLLCYAVLTDDPEMAYKNKGLVLIHVPHHSSLPAAVPICLPLWMYTEGLFPIWNKLLLWQKCKGFFKAAS